MQNNQESLKFAVMVRGSHMQKWQLDCYTNLINSGFARNVLWIIEDEHSSTINTGSKLLNYPWRRLLFRQYYRHLFRPRYFSREAIPFDPEIPQAHCTALRKGKYSEYFTAADIQKIQSYKPDFILKFGFGIIRGDILECTRFGVWSFHHGDEQKYRGVPPAFHEIMRNDPETASILQRLTEKLDGGIILRKGIFKTINHSWAANLDQALELSLKWPADVCREIITQKTFPGSGEGVETNAPVYREPENFTMTQFLVKLAVNKIKFHLNELFLPENWETGLIEASPEDLLGIHHYTIENDKVHWQSAGQRNRYLADSFAIQQGNKVILLFEDYDYHKMKASLSAAIFDETTKKTGEVKSLLQEKWHLSYPFILETEKGIFCIPESMHHGSVEMYKLDTEALKLTHYKTLIPGLSAADGTLIHHQNHWYFFFTPPHATNTELYIYHSKSLDGPFIPHTLNPVKINVANARPAGPFFTSNGNLYRPAQDSSETYGGRIIINRVKLLTPDDYLEETANILLPPHGYKGIHTLSFAGKYMYFDSKKFKFSGAAFRNHLLKKLKLKHF